MHYLDYNDAYFAMKIGMKNNRGFTILGIAMLLVIIGALIGIGAEIVGTLTKRAKIIETKKLTDAALEALASYGASGNTLPATGSFSSAVKNPNDAWTRSFYYILDTKLTDTAVGGICGRKTTNLTVKVCPDSGCSTPTSTISNVAFIVLSGGENYNNQTAGTQAVSSATTVNVYNVDVAIDNYTSDINSAVSYDDIVKWVTLDELRIKAGCSVPQLRVVNNELPRGYKNNAYSAKVFGDGGVPYSSGGTYMWCRQETSAITGLTFSPSISSADCLTLDEASWVQADYMTISGQATATASNTITFFVRDDNDSSGTNDNIAQRALLLEISGTEGAVCEEYRVWNNLGYGRYFIREADCDYISSGSEVTSESKYLNSGEDLRRYNDSECGKDWESTLTYGQAQTADTDSDCCIYFNASNRSCP